jgi:hypothetical protein
MAKKTKLHSKNPKYWGKTQNDDPIIKERKLLCNAPVRDISGEIIEGHTIPVYGIWTEPMQVKVKKEEKWWKSTNLN